MKYALPVAAIVAISLSACSSTPSAPPAQPAAKPAAPAPAAAAPAAPAAPAKPAAAPAPAAKPDPFAALKDPKSLLSKREVFFEYDKYEVELDYIPVVEAHARFLKANKNAKVLIQGNADERGSREYNLALGQKRADAIKKTLTLLGATEAQIETVSLGEEKPRNTSQNEAGWAENRRGDILYSGEY